MNPQEPAAGPSRFACNICEEPSEKICGWCTKDVCQNHLCAKCGRCSDCCDCPLALEDSHS